ncbi:MAG: hypothetical protein VYE64_00375 [Planctomycetota bacterium]|nr:hypothetical protein [Planctomycetota bacterium]
MKRKYRITARRSVRYYAFLFMLFGLFLTLLEIRSGWIGKQSWDQAIWRAAFSFVGIGGLGAILWISPLFYVKGNWHSFGKVAKANRRPRRSFAEMIHADTAQAESTDESADLEDASANEPID